MHGIPILSAKSAASAKMLAMLILSLAGISHATDYYVAETGSDANQGTLDKPFLTIQKAADIMKAGDRCLIRRGTYRETVVPANSGAKGAPIVFMPYNKERVVVSGAEVITGWSKHEGNIYKAPIDWTLGKEFNQVFVNGKMAIEARFPNITASHVHPEKPGYPNTGFSLKRPHLAQRDDIDRLIWPPKAACSYKKNQNRMVFTRDRNGALNLPAFKKPADFYKGGIYWGYHGAWRAQSARITGSDDTSLVIKHSWTEPRMLMGQQGGGFITGIYGLLDEGNEWYHDSAGTLYLWPPDSGDMSGHVVEAKKRHYAFELRDKDYIEIRGLFIFGASIIMPFADNVTIDGCYFRYITHYTLLDAQEGDFAPGHEGIEMQGHNVTIRNCAIEYSAGPGIKMNNPDTLAEGATGGCKNPVVENNLIRYIDYYGSYGAGINTCTKGGKVAHNTIYQTGRSGLGIGCGGGWFIGHHVNIQYNRIYDCMITATDGGCVYTYGVTARHSDFSYNWIYNNHQKEGSLLMLDLGGWDWYIHHNVFWVKDGKNYSTIGPSYSRNLVYNNTVIDQGWAKKTGHDKSNNLTCYGNPDSCGIVDAEHFDFSLKATSLAIDKGDSIVSRGPHKIDETTGDTTWYNSPTGIPMHDTITSDMFTGESPDLGAYEYGMPAWKAGHDWGEPDWEYPLKSEGAAIAGLISVPAVHPRLVVKRHAIMITGERWQLSMYDAAGRIVQSVACDKKERTTVRISITDFASGIYLAQLKSKAGIQTVPMIRF